MSICEEHVENEIELWKQLKQYLYQNSIELIQRNVELYGVKLIQQTNKIKNLNISQNLNIKRLMIYKWCERASDIDLNSPLLVLYWQKFFNIYLSRFQIDQSSAGAEIESSRSAVISAALNFFLSSPSLSSFIKQLKKTLENSIKFYKSKISDSPQTKEYYQNLVKIFHA